LERLLGSPLSGQTDDAHVFSPRLGSFTEGVHTLDLKETEARLDGVFEPLIIGFPTPKWPGANLSAG